MCVNASVSLSTQTSGPEGAGSSVQVLPPNQGREHVNGPFLWFNSILMNLSVVVWNRNWGGAPPQFPQSLVTLCSFGPQTGFTGASIVLWKTEYWLCKVLKALTKCNPQHVYNGTNTSLDMKHRHLNFYRQGNTSPCISACSQSSFYLH